MDGVGDPLDVNVSVTASPQRGGERRALYIDFDDTAKSEWGNCVSSEVREILTI